MQRRQGAKNVLFLTGLTGLTGFSVAALCELSKPRSHTALVRPLRCARSLWTANTDAEKHCNPSHVTLSEVEGSLIDSGVISG